MCVLVMGHLRIIYCLTGLFFTILDAQFLGVCICNLRSLLFQLCAAIGLGFPSLNITLCAIRCNRCKMFKSDFLTCLNVNITNMDIWIVHSWRMRIGTFAGLQIRVCFCVKNYKLMVAFMLVGLVVRTFALHHQGRGFDSRFRPVCMEF